MVPAPLRRVDENHDATANAAALPHCVFKRRERWGCASAQVRCAVDEHWRTPPVRVARAPRNRPRINWRTRVCGCQWFAVYYASTHVEEW